MTMRTFYLVRHHDETGISGEGIVAEGILWAGGSAELHWLTDWETFVHWPGGLDEIIAVHGHHGATVIRFLDELDESQAASQRPCPTCSGPIRETVGMVCQSCGTDYATPGSPPLIAGN